MGGTGYGDNHEWNKPRSNIQISHVFAHMWNIGLKR
jgi:hypothetical protein